MATQKTAGWMGDSGRSSGRTRVRHMTMASMSVVSVKLSSALTRMRSSCLTSRSVITLLMQP